MSVTSGFFPSLSGDRKYSALQMGMLFDGLIQDGVYMGIGKHFEVTAEPIPVIPYERVEGIYHAANHE